MTKAKSFPILRGVMAKYGLTQEKMAQIAGLKSYQTFGLKLSGQRDFTFTEMVNVSKHLRGLGEDLSVEDIFFAG